MPEGVISVHERTSPFGWLGVLAEAPPSNDELIYASHESGFALLSTRSPELSRLHPGGSGRSRRQLARQQDMGAAASATRVAGRVADRGNGHSEGHHADEEFCRRTDAVRAILHCGRCRAHRASHRRERPEPHPVPEAYWRTCLSNQAIVRSIARFDAASL
jgi:hypothetical protein